MYLTMRATGFLVGAMILHGLTDPTTILATGALDELHTGAAENGFLTAAAAVTFPLIAAGLLLLIFIRGRVADRREPASRLGVIGRTPVTVLRTSGDHPLRHAVDIVGVPP